MGLVVRWSKLVNLSEKNSYFWDQILMSASIPSNTKNIYTCHIYLKLYGFVSSALSFTYVLVDIWESLPFWKSKQIEKQIVKSHDTQEYCITQPPPPHISLPLLSQKISQHLRAPSGWVHWHLKRWEMIFRAPPQGIYSCKSYMQWIDHWKLISNMLVFYYMASTMERNTCFVLKQY